MDNNTETLGFFFPDHEKRYQEKLDGIRKEAKRNAVTHGKKNWPSLDTTELLPCIAGTKSSYERVHTEDIGMTKPEVHASKLKTHKETVATRFAELDKEHQELEHENMLAERSLDGMTYPEPVRPNLWLGAILLLLYLGEVHFNSLAFEYFGGPPIGTYLMGVCIAALEAMLAYHIAKNVSRLKDEGRRIDLKTAALIATLGALIVTMTVMRAYAASALASRMPSWIYFVLNVALVVGTVLFSKKVFPSQKEKDEVTAVRKCFDAIQKRKERMQLIPQIKQALAEQAKKEEQQYRIVSSHVQRTTERTRAHYRETVELYKQESLIIRSDNGTPACFLHETPDLDLLTYTDDL